MFQTVIAPERPSASTAAPPLSLEQPQVPRQTAPAPRARMAYIDGLRGLAMLMVLGFHCWLSAGVALPLAIGRWRFDGTFLLQHGYLGVHLFLVLSGFCLAYPLTREGAAGMRLEIGRFARRRAWRILPPYYVALALFSLRPLLEKALATAAGHPHHAVEFYTPGQVLSHVFMVHNFSPAWQRTINGSFWSLALEWQLYLVFPLLVWGFRRWGPGRTLLASLALTMVYRAWVYATQVIPGTMPYTSEQSIGCFFAYGLMPGRLFEFVLGMTAAVSLAGARGAPAKSRLYGYLAGAITLGLAGFVVAHAWSPFAPVTDILWGLAFFCLVMYGGVRSAHGGGWLDSRPMVALGLISYSIYLIHEPLLRRAEPLLRAHFSPLVTLLLMAGVVAPMAIGCGWLYFRTVEARFLKPK
jgi:peptidoglycan/LPS O-acetylase OafA/YrhL